MTTINGGKSSCYFGRNALSDWLLAGNDDRGLLSVRVSLINGGRDTEFRLRDGSTIVLKGVTHVEAEFFH